MNVAEDPTWQAFSRPGRASGFKRIDVKLLPAFMTNLAFGKATKVRRDQQSERSVPH